MGNKQNKRKDIKMKMINIIQENQNNKGINLIKIEQQIMMKVILK